MDLVTVPALNCVYGTVIRSNKTYNTLIFELEINTFIKFKSQGNQKANKKA